MTFLNISRNGIGSTTLRRSILSAGRVVRALFTGSFVVTARERTNRAHRRGDSVCRPVLGDYMVVRLVRPRHALRQAYPPPAKSKDNLWCRFRSDGIAINYRSLYSSPPTLHPCPCGKWWPAVVHLPRGPKASGREVPSLRVGTKVFLRK